MQMVDLDVFLIEHYRLLRHLNNPCNLPWMLRYLIKFTIKLGRQVLLQTVSCLGFEDCLFFQYCLLILRKFKHLLHLTSLKKFMQQKNFKNFIPNIWHYIHKSMSFLKLCWEPPPQLNNRDFEVGFSLGFISQNPKEFLRAISYLMQPSPHYFRIHENYAFFMLAKWGGRLTPMIPL